MAITIKNDSVSVDSRTFDRACFCIVFCHGLFGAMLSVFKGFKESSLLF